MNSRRPPGPYGSEWVVVWLMFLLTLACMVAALYVGTARGADFLILDESGQAIARCQTPFTVDYSAVAAVCRVPPGIFANGFED